MNWISRGREEKCGKEGGLIAGTDDKEDRGASAREDGSGGILSEGG